MYLGQKAFQFCSINGCTEKICSSGKTWFLHCWTFLAQITVPVPAHWKSTEKQHEWIPPSLSPSHTCHPVSLFTWLGARFLLTSMRALGPSSWSTLIFVSQSDILTSLPGSWDTWEFGTKNHPSLSYDAKRSLRDGCVMFRVVLSWLKKTNLRSDRRLFK